MFVAAYLTWRLIDVQIRQGPKLAGKAMNQHSETVDLFAKRGSIFDRDGAVLVRSLPSESVYAVPTNISDPQAVSIAVAPLLAMKAPVLESILREPSQFRWLARKIPHETAEKIRALKIVGINMKTEETGVRFAPSGHLASTALGFVGLDEDGLGGLEYSFNSYLRGMPGKMRIEADQFGRAIPFADATTIERAIAGRNLGLTVDAYLQFEAERALSVQVKASHARSGTAIVMDPYTGEILALANVPDFDPTRLARFPSTSLDNAIENAYEPGSTFKLITAAAAIEGGMDTHRRFPARDRIEVGGRPINNAEDGMMASALGSETMEDIIAYSHNVGAAEVGMATGAKQMYKTIRAFGFGDSSHVELPGENVGIVPPVSEWSGSSLATISFGHGISTTPLAMIRAYSAIANGGLLMRPRIVRSLYDERGNVMLRYPAEVERRVISERTAAILRSYLVAAVKRGTGNPAAHVPGYTTAGKTGTAQIESGGRYESGAYNASFIGFVPADHPKFVILVKVERPQGTYYGSSVAAPVFVNLARMAMLHAGDMPTSVPVKRLVRRTTAAQ